MPLDQKVLRIGIYKNKNILEVDFITKSVSSDNDWLTEKNLFDYKNAFFEEAKEFLGLIPRRRVASLDDGMKIYSYV